MNDKEEMLERISSAIDILKMVKMAVRDENSKDFSYAFRCLEEDIEIIKERSKDLFIVENTVSKF